MKILADAGDEENWLHQRRGYISASDIFKLLTHDELCIMGWWKESWMADTEEEIFERKLDGSSPDFKDPVAVAWGKVEEDHNRELFENYSGIITRGCHSFIGHGRWPYLSTTLDGFSFVQDEWQGLYMPEMIDDPQSMTRAILRLPRNERCLLEMKQTGEYSMNAWTKGYNARTRRSIILGEFVAHPPTCPVYYLAQVQTQMALAEFDWNLAVVKGGASHMAAHSYKLRPVWLDILDAVNSRVAKRMESIRKELNGRT